MVHFPYTKFQFCFYIFSISQNIDRNVHFLLFSTDQSKVLIYSMWIFFLQTTSVVEETNWKFSPTNHLKTDKKWWFWDSSLLKRWQTLKHFSTANSSRQCLMLRWLFYLFWHHLILDSASMLFHSSIKLFLQFVIKVVDWLFLEWKKLKFTGTMTQFNKA